MGALAVHEEKRSGMNDPRFLRAARGINGSTIELLSDFDGEVLHTLLSGIRRSTRFNLATGTTLRDSDFIVGVEDVSSATLKLKQLPLPGQTWIVIDTNGHAAARNLTISSDGSELINGSSTFVLNVNYGWVMLVTDGTNYFARRLS